MENQESATTASKVSTKLLAIGGLIVAIIGAAVIMRPATNTEANPFHERSEVSIDKPVDVNIHLDASTTEMLKSLVKYGTGQPGYVGHEPTQAEMIALDRAMREYSAAIQRGEHPKIPPELKAVGWTEQVAASTSKSESKAIAKPKATPRPKAEPVAKAEPKFQTVARRVCEPQTVTVEVDVPDPIKQQERSATGSLLGAGIGALLGNQVGGGTGKTIATIGGAVAGAYAGDRMSNGNGQQPTQTSHKEQRQATTTVCRDVSEQVRID